MLTVACVWVKANVPYTADYVEKLAIAVTRHLPRQHRFVCLTDDPPGCPDAAEPIAIRSPAPLAGWWAKLRLFDRTVPLGEDRVLYLDLDSLIVAPLEPIAEWAAPLAVIPYAGQFKGRGAKRAIAKFNSSVMVFDRPATYRLWDHWQPKWAETLWGDQDYIAQALPDTSMMPLAWFPRLSEIGKAGVIPPEAKVILAKHPKPAEAARTWPWVAERWG